MPNRRPPEPVEDYTNAFLVTAWGLLVMIFWVIAALAGYLWVALTATALNWGITRLGRASR